MISSLLHSRVRCKETAWKHRESRTAASTLISIRFTRVIRGDRAENSNKGAKVVAPALEGSGCEIKARVIAIVAGSREI